MSKKLKYVEIVKTFLPYSYNLEYESILKEAQDMARKFHLPMDTPLTAESMLTFQAKTIDQHINDILAEDEISDEEKDVLNKLKSSKAQIIDDKDSILATLKNMGLPGRDAAEKLSRNDANIEKIFRCPQVKTIGGFIIALLSIASLSIAYP